MPLYKDNLVLYSGHDVEQNPAELDSLPEKERKACLEIVSWTRSFLCRPHPDLGREGPVCPFTQPSLNKNLFWLTTVPGEHIDMDTASQIVEEMRTWFLELEPQSNSETILKTILILFPDVTDEVAAIELDALQKKLKPEFVKRGIMVGQFYNGCPESGLWNDHFHPLESPIPLLAIRNMVPSDFPFLHGKRGNSHMLIAYLNRFGTNIPTEVKQLMVDALEASELPLRGKR